jgi:hypothetical protein
MNVFKLGSIGNTVAMIAFAFVSLTQAGQFSANALEEEFNAKMTGYYEEPPVETNGSGEAFFIINTVEEINSDGIPYTIGLKDINKITAVHIHDKSNGDNNPIVYTLFHPKEATGDAGEPFFVRDVITSDNLNGPLKGKDLSDLVTLMRDGNAYVNVQTEDHPDGEIGGLIESSLTSGSNENEGELEAQEQSRGAIRPYLGSGNDFGLTTPNETLPSTDSKTTLIEDGFDLENRGNGVLNYSGFANWNVIDGTVDLLGTNFYDIYPGNGLYVDLDGSSLDAAKFEYKQEIALEPGNYTLEFDMSGYDADDYQRGETNSMTVNLGDLYKETFSIDAPTPFERITRDINVVSPTTANLAFDHAGGDNFGILIDNVKLYKTAGSKEAIGQKFGQQDMLTYSDPYGRFSMDYPSDWQPTTALIPIQGVNTPLLQFISLDLATLSVLAQPVPETYITPSVMLEAFVDGAKTEMQNPSIIQDVECNKHVLSDTKACTIIANGYQNGIAMNTLFANTIINGNAYYFVATDTASNFYNSLPTFEQVMSSFKVLQSKFQSHQLPPSSQTENESYSDNLGKENNETSSCERSEMTNFCI